MATVRPTNHASASTIHQLKITLSMVRPPIWRRIQVPSSTSLGKLHPIIQIAMGWGGGHLHAFQVGGVEYGDPGSKWEGENEDQVKVKQIAPREKQRFRYEYDFGDGWVHEILVEKIIPKESGVQYPRCIAGKRACPPEDCGGPWGYASLLEALADPSNDEHKDMAEWIGGSFDAEAFDLDQINRRLQTGGTWILG